MIEQPRLFWERKGYTYFGFDGQDDQGTLQAVVFQTINHDWQVHLYFANGGRRLKTNRPSEGKAAAEGAYRFYLDVRDSNA